MKRILILLALSLGMHASALAQKSTKAPPPSPPPPPRPAPLIRYEPLKTEKEIREAKYTVYEKLWNDEKSWPLSFAHGLAGDTLIMPKQTFKKQLEIGNNGIRLETSSAKDTMRFTDGKPAWHSGNYVKYDFFKVKMVKDIAVLTDKETGKVLKFRLLLNSKKTKILKLQEVESKAIYTPAEYVGVTIMMN